MKPLAPNVSAHLRQRPSLTGASSSFQATPTITGGVTSGSSNATPSQPSRLPRIASSSASAVPSASCKSAAAKANNAERHNEFP